MKTNRPTLTQALSGLSKVVPSKGGATWMKHVLVGTSEDGRTTIEGHDAGTRVRVSFPSQGITIPPALVNLKDLRTIVGKARQVKGFDGTVKLTVAEDGRLAVWMYGQTHHVGRLPLEGWDPISIGEPGEDAATMKLEACRTDAAFSYALVSASMDETRGALRAVHLYRGHVVGTDGHRLHVTKGFEGICADKTVPLPQEAAEAATILGRMFGVDDETPVTLTYSEASKVVRIAFETEMGVRVQIDAIPLEVEVPEFSHVWLTGGTQDLRMLREHLERAVDSVVPVSTTASFTFDGTTLTIMGKDKDTGLEVRDSVEVDVPSGNTVKAFTYNFNPAYVLDALAGLPELSVTLRFTSAEDGLAPMEIHQKGHREIVRWAVVMPMRGDAPAAPVAESTETEQAPATDAAPVVALVTDAAPAPAPEVAPVAESAPTVDPAPVPETAPAPAPVAESAPKGRKGRKAA